jgi:RNA-binding protein
MPLTPTQTRYLRGLAHGLGAVVLLGNKGATAAVIKELDGALNQHELVKVKLSAADAAERKAQLETLVQGTQAQSVQQIGHVAVLFRRNADEPKIALPR